EEVPLIVEDCPSPALMREMELEYPDELCGLHDGVPLTERSVQDQAALPEHILIYRMGIIALACDDEGNLDDDELTEQVRITILHELGHHFGLDEDDLDRLGYA